MESQMIHHSALSFRKLRSMKITDRQSCSVVILRNELASPVLLSQPRFFGQFGLVRSIRLLQDKSPCQVYVRFNTEAAAVAAVAWCSAEPSIFADAKHGYQKYCVKFINNQKCTKANCPNRHAWCDTKDIRTFARTRCDGSDVTVSPSGACPPAPPLPCPPSAEQQRVASMVAQNQMQSAFINQLLSTIKALRDQNDSLKMEMTQLTLAQRQQQLQAQMQHARQALLQQQQQQLQQQQAQVQMPMASPLSAQPEAEWIEWDTLPDIVDEAIKAESHQRGDCASMNSTNSVHADCGSMYSSHSGSTTPVRSMYSSD